MGPERNNALFNVFNAFGEEPKGVLVTEFERSQRAQAVIAELSEQFEEMPITSPVAEPTLVAKLYALSRLGVDSMGVVGFNPMSMIHPEDNGASVKAVAAPMHDSFEADGHEIKTRAILIKPPTAEQSGRRSMLRAGDDVEPRDDLEFFGLNIYAGATNIDVDDQELTDFLDSVATAPATSSSDIQLTPAAAAIVEKEKRIVVTEGEPLEGITSVFAVRHKKNGTVKLYGVTIQLDPFPNQTDTRETRNELKVKLPNQTVATVAVLEGAQFDQALDEFARAASMIKRAKEIDPTQTRFSLIERHAMRISMQGAEADLFAEPDAPAVVDRADSA